MERVSSIPEMNRQWQFQMDALVSNTDIVIDKIRGNEGTPMWRILLRQVSNSLTLVLVIAMSLSYGINDYIEGSVITAVIFLNIIIGYV